jgi:hypothetical protein
VNSTVMLALICAFGGPVLGVAFGAGSAYFLIKQSRKDVNGLGSKVNREIDRATKFRETMMVAIMLIVPSESRTQIAKILTDAEGE